MVNTRESVDHGSWKHRESINSLTLGKVDEVDCEKGLYQIQSSKKQSIMSDLSISDTDERSLLQRCQRRMSILLHTHVVLITVCSLAALDALCVIGQLVCDILIMREKLDHAEDNDDALTQELFTYIPHLNRTLHPKWNLDAILAVLQGTDVHWDTQGPLPAPPPWMAANLSAMVPNAVPWLTNSGLNTSHLIHEVGGILHRHRRALAPRVPGHEVDHGVLYNLTHACHIGSMVILSVLLLETLCKVFAMGSKLKHHKLEVFDACVVTISWCLDVGFYQGIWAHPGTVAATILIYMLPWRVVRIVNSFVLVIQEKDHVQLKIVKQRLRQSLKKSKTQDDKRHVLTHEVKALAGLCRKLGANENEIQACSPSGGHKRRSSVTTMLLNPKTLIQNIGTSRRRSSLHSAIERTASLAMMSACASLGSNPSLFDMGADEDEFEEDEYGNKHKALEATSSAAPTMKSAFSSTTLDSNSVVLSMDPHDQHDHTDTNDSGINTPHYDTSSTASKEEDKHSDASGGHKRSVVWTSSNDSVPPTYHNAADCHIAVSKLDSNTRL